MITCWSTIKKILKKKLFSPKSLTISNPNASIDTYPLHPPGNILMVHITNYKYILNVRFILHSRLNDTTFYVTDGCCTHS